MQEKNRIFVFWVEGMDFGGSDLIFVVCDGGYWAGADRGWD